MTQINIVETEAEVTQRYLTDPEFHARVQLAVQLTAASMRRATGVSMGRDFAAAVVQACAYGLAMATVDVATNMDDKTAASMMASAKALGFELVKRSTDE